MHWGGPLVQGSNTGTAPFWGFVFRSKQYFHFRFFHFCVCHLFMCVSVWPVYKCWFAESLPASPAGASWRLCTSCPTNGCNMNSFYLTSLHIIELFSTLHHVFNLLGSIYIYNIYFPMLCNTSDLAFLGFHN